MLSPLATLCGGSLSAQAIRDSAGVRIVRYTRGDRPLATWQVDSEPVLQIGGDGREGPTEFSNVVGVVRLRDGRIAVANAATHEIRLFDSSGRFLRALGRRGRGPGEFTSPGGMRRVADTLIGVDNQLVAHVFSPDGQLVRTFARPQIPGYTIGQWLGWLPSGVGVYLANVAPDNIPRGRSTQLVALALVPHGSDPYVLPERYGGWEQHREDAAAGTRPIGFTPRSHGVVTSHGIWVGYSESFALTRLDSTGRVVLRVQRELERAPVTEDDRAFYAGLEVGATRNVPEPMRAMLLARARRITFAEEHPAFSAMVASQLNELWVNRERRGFQLGIRYHVPERVSRWSAFDAAGVWLAEVELPARFFPFDIGHDYVAGVARNADDVERIVVLRLRR